MSLQVYDAGDYFQLCQLTYSDGDGEQGDPLWRVIVTKPEGIKMTNPEQYVVMVMGVMGGGVWVSNG